MSPLPDEYLTSYHALLDGLEVDILWGAYLSDNGAEWAGRAITAALLLIGETPATWVQPWSNRDTQALGALILTDQLLVEVSVGPPVNQQRVVTASAIPLVVESLEVSSDTTPWVNTLGSWPGWPGNVSAVVRVAGHDPIVIPGRSVTDQTHRDAVRAVVAFLAERVRATALG